MNRRFSRWRSIAILLALLGGCEESDSGRSPSAAPLPAGVGFQVGMQAPDFEGKDQDGHPLRLSSLRGNVVLIDFWGFW